MNVPILGGVNSPSKAQEAAPVATPFVAPLTGRETLFGRNLRDSSQLQGKAEPAPVPVQKSVGEMRSDFKASRTTLRAQNDEDKAVVDHLRNKVDARNDLNSREKEWLYAAELHAYSSDQVMRMTHPDKCGQPWAPKQEERFRALAATHAASKELLGAITPHIERADGATPQVDNAAAGSKSANPWAEAARRQAQAAQNTPPAGAPAGDPPAGGTPPANGAPANADPTDPMVRIWEMRRKEAQDMFNDFKMLLQMQLDSKTRILASRQAFFWEMYKKHSGFICETWRK